MPARPIYSAIEWCVQRLAWVPAWLSGIATVFGGIAFVVSGTPGTAEYSGGWFWTGVGSTALGITLSGFVERARRRTTENLSSEGGSFQIALEQGFLPSLEDLAKMAGKPQTHRQRDYQRVLDRASQVLVISFTADVRVVVYRLTDAILGSQELAVENSHGRRGKPKPFIEGDGGRGDAVFDWIEGGASLFVDDLAVRKLPGWQGSGKGYKTFISAPILIDGKPKGMLTVDAPTPGDLDETDRSLVESLAALVGVAFALHTPKDRA
ncbi:GAF domain-containing protein [Curtobacterium sp. PhB191]|uniref:GAF domain-containing protein n=1 Tax=Curtobacterium sp. PhB191 TaxID=2485202 RepID=UPI00104878F5|nr:GAF domain-containing protein [Curtobacterium sp. PhB191]